MEYWPLDNGTGSCHLSRTRSSRSRVLSASLWLTKPKAMRTILIVLATLLISLSGCSQPSNNKAVETDLNVQQFKAELAKGEATFVDVRTAKEYASGHIKGSTNIDWTAPDYETRFAEIDKTKPVLLYCQAGGRSGQAKEYLESKGYMVKHLEDGYSSWTKAGEAVEK